MFSNSNSLYSTVIKKSLLCYLFIKVTITYYKKKYHSLATNENKNVNYRFLRIYTLGSLIPNIDNI
ncbi:hypothetical protein GCM10011459_08020 [Limosilactobacillus caviae]|uniref:Uncharacterized protein n=1 Tax=Limosilactobacillus caviae TaxID=1769424 RepID=A0ABQ2C6B5_9LACO|nr:hypothetical protein GCM10011459_08020 [Limosilactobacillus caviae]